MKIQSSHQTVVCITCNDGTSWTTHFNGTPGTAKTYFLGRTFTDENPNTGHEITRRVYQVEILEGGAK